MKQTGCTKISALGFNFCGGNGFLHFYFNVSTSTVWHLLVSPHYTAPCLTPEKICLVLSSLPRYLALVIQDSASADLVNHFDKHCISSVA